MHKNFHYREKNKKTLINTTLSKYLVARNPLRFAEPPRKYLYGRYPAHNTFASRLNHLLSSYKKIHYKNAISADFL